VVLAFLDLDLYPREDFEYFGGRFNLESFKAFS
jgi:hypothetical protein